MRPAKTPSDILSRAKLLKMSGYDFMVGMLEKKIAGPSIAETMGFTLKTVELGKVTFCGAPEFNTTNPMGTVHGGWYGALLDSAMACAVMTKVPQGSFYTTLEYKVSIVKPVPLNSRVECIGVTDHVGRSTGVAHGEIRGVSSDKLYATGTTTCIIITPDPALNE
ncbi:MAG: PaaI family thioesterase [Aestuariivita sp.]|nr:PaaI family thioesterase [Aestuariivita sp.]